MRIKTLLLVALISFITYGQKQPDSSIVLDSNISEVNLHQLTGVAVVTTNGGVYGINGETGKKIWEFNETGFVKGLNQLGQNGGSSFREIPFSPFGKFGESIFNIKTGSKVIDSKTNGYNKIVYNTPIPDKKAILFFAKTEKTKAKLFLADVMNNNIIWESAIEANKKVTNHGVSNFIENKDRIAFVVGKTVFLINKNDGNVILTEKYDAGALFFTENNKSLIAVENKSSSLIGGALKAGFTMGLSLLGKKAIGKELIAFDVNSGKEVWKRPIKLDEGFMDYQFIDNKMFLIHKDGAKLYDYNTGKEVWKKEFKKKKVKGAEKTSEGYLVYYKNKKHLVDNTGKKIWKKSQKVVKNVDFEADDDEDFTVFEYDKGTIFVTPNRIEYFEKGNEKRVYKISVDSKDDKLAFDEKNNNIILLSGKKLYVLNPDKSLGKEQYKKIDFNDYKKIHSIEIRDNSYFINSNWEFVITDFEGNIKKKKYYKQPGEGLRHLKNIGSGLLALGAAEITVTTSSNEQAMSNSSNFVNGRNQAKTTSQTFHASKHHKEFAAASDYLYTPERYNAFKATKNSAFFYTVKDGKKVLLQINKDTGDIEESFEFGVDKPKYKIDKPAKRIYFRRGKELKIFSYN